VLDPLAFLYADLLTSPSAETRLQGIERWMEHYGHIKDIFPLLDDDAPVVFPQDGRHLITEVRARALVAVQDRHRVGRRPWEIGPVIVRAPMPAEHALHRAVDLLTGIPAEDRGLLLAGVEESLDERVRPAEEDREICIAYLVLQALGEVPYLRQTPDAVTMLTPLQHEIQLSAMTGPRPRPHLRFEGEDPGEPAGYMYADHLPGTWVIDLNESPFGREVRAYVGLVLRAERGGVPRVRHDEKGRPRTDRDGRLSVTGILAHDTTEVVEYLRSVAAFVARRYQVQLVP
jgi:hypothetical protein